MIGMQFDLGEDVNVLCDMVYCWLQDCLVLMVVQVDCDNVFFNVLWLEFGELGLLGVIVLEEWGGVGMFYLVYVVVIEEIVCVSVSISLFYGVYFNLCVNQIKLNGSDEQCVKYLFVLCVGIVVGVLVMFEEGVGSDVVLMKLCVEKCNDCYVLNGNKYWIINVFDVDMLVVYVKIDLDVGFKGIIVFIVECGMVGFFISLYFDKLGMCGLSMGELIFQDCEVFFDNVLGCEGGGVWVLMLGLDFECVVLLGIGFGIMVVCLDEVLFYVCEWWQFGQFIGLFQLMQGKIVDMYVVLNIVCVYVYEVVCVCDVGWVM